MANQRETFQLSAYSIATGFNGCSFDLAMKTGRDIALLTLDRKIPQIFFDNKFASIVSLPAATENTLYMDDAKVKNAGFGKGILLRYLFAAAIQVIFLQMKVVSMDI